MDLYQYFTQLCQIDFLDASLQKLSPTFILVTRLLSSLLEGLQFFYRLRVCCHPLGGVFTDNSQLNKPVEALLESTLVEARFVQGSRQVIYHLAMVKPPFLNDATFLALLLAKENNIACPAIRDMPVAPIRSVLAQVHHPVAPLNFIYLGRCLYGLSHFCQLLLLTLALS